MHASRALTPTERRISTVTFGVAPLLLAIVIVLLVTATPFGRTVDEGPLWLLGPIGVLVFAGLWFVVGPRAFGRPVLGAVCVAIVTVAVATSIAFLPVLGVAQSMVFVYAWVVLERPGRSIVASAVVCVAIVVAATLRDGLDGLGFWVLIETCSFFVSVFIGLIVTRAEALAEQRRALLDDLAASQAEVRELARLAGATAERERLSRDLHDTLAQTLAGLTMLAERSGHGVRRAAEAIRAVDPGAHAQLEREGERLDRVVASARASLGEIRGILAETAPVADASTSFEAALHRLALRFRDETGIVPDVRLDLDERAVPRETEVVLLRCVQEALANVRRHSGADRAEVHVLRHGGDVVLRITDDGRGFDPDAVTGRGYGLPSLRERARTAGGRMELVASPGAGTSITVRLPLVPAAAEQTHADAREDDPDDE